MRRSARSLLPLLLLVACGGSQPAETTPEPAAEQQTAESEAPVTVTPSGACAVRLSLAPRLRDSTGFPVVDQAGERFIFLDPRPVAVQTATPDVYAAWRVLFLDATSGDVERQVEIATPEEIDPIHYIDMNCCDGVEEGCDPFLCGPGEEGEQYEREQNAREAERSAALDAELGDTEYCDLEALPESALTVNPRESWGEPFFVTLSRPGAIEEHAIQIPAGDDAAESGEYVHERSAFYDRRSGRTLVRVAFVASDNTSARVVFRVLP